MKNRIFVTGATGFVGSWLVRKLVANDENVSILIRNKNIHHRLSDISKKLSLYEGDLQSESLNKIVDKIKPTIIFHLAARGALPGQKVTIQDVINTNLKGLINLTNAAKKHKVKLFVNTGSSSEYGVKEKPMKESDILIPVNDYGVSKSVATLYCQKIAVTESFPVITVRLFSPFGYGDDTNRLIPFVINKALSNESISLNSKTNVRDFIYIEDVIDAYMQTLKKKVKPGEIINIGSGKQHSIYDIVSAIIKISGSHSELKWGTMPQQSRQIEPKMWQANIQKAKQILNWEPKYTLKQGLEKIIQQYRNQNYD